MSDNWYYAKDGQRSGPVLEEELKRLAASGQLRPTDHVWKKGMANWVAASTVEGLFPEVAELVEVVEVEPEVVPTDQTPKIVTVKCDNCKASFRIDRNQDRRIKMQCTACGQIFKLPELENFAAASGEASDPDIVWIPCQATAEDIEKNGKAVTATNGVLAVVYVEKEQEAERWVVVHVKTLMAVCKVRSKKAALRLAKHTWDCLTSKEKETWTNQPEAITHPQKYAMIRKAVQEEQNKETEEKLASRLTAPLLDTRPLSDEEMRQVCARLTEYAGQIPYLGVEEFGAAIVPLAATHIPLYYVALGAMHEKRRVVGKEKPYTGWNIPPLKTTDQDIDIWQYDYPLPGKKETTRENQVDDSQQVHDCPQCGAVGQVTCEACGGEQRITCPDCKGTQIVRCPVCKGAGQVQQQRRSATQVEKRCFCTTAFGKAVRGFTELSKHASHQCQTCFGRGYYYDYDIEYYEVACPGCDQMGKVQCGKCDATGIISCPPCEGSGKVTCPRCQGHQKMATWLVVEQTFSSAEDSEIVFCSEMPKEVAETLDAKDSIPVLEFRTKELPADPQCHEDLKVGVGVVADAMRRLNAKARAPINKQCHIAQQCVQIGRGDFIRLKYQFRQKEYEMWLVGKSKMIYAPSSPFVDLTRSRLEEALRAWAEGKTSEAGDYLRQCWDIGKKDPGCEAVVKQMGDKIPTGLKTAAAASSAAVAAKAIFQKGATGIANAADAIKQSKFGKWLLGGK